MQNSSTSFSHLNEIGVTLMQRGDFRQAGKILREATGYMKDALETPQGQQQFQTRSISAAHLLQHVVPVAALPSELVQDEGGLFEVFQFAFLPPSIPGDEWETVNQSRASVANLYNLALAYHIQGLSNCSSSRELKLARNLYRMALSIVESIQPDLSSDNFMLLLILAVFNNLGQICATFYDAADTQKCIGAISKLSDSDTVQDIIASDAGNIFSFFKLSCAVYHYVGSLLFAIAPQA